MSPEGEAKGLIRPFGAYAPQRSFGFASGWGGVPLRPFTFLLFYHPEAARPKGLTRSFASLRMTPTMSP